MLKTYTQTMLLRTSDCDFKGTWRPSAIFEAMQEVSGMHSHLMGCGRDILVRKGAVWVLSRVEVCMDRYPGVGDALTLETFPTPVRRCFFPRYFLFRDEKKELLGRAVSLWVLLDIAARKMASPELVAGLLPDNSDLAAPMGFPGPVEEAPEERIFERVPAYTDLDVNLHVNNARYIDWLCDALGIDALGKAYPASLRVSYDAEVRPGQALTLRLGRQGSAFSLLGQEGDKRYFGISGQLMDRQPR